MDLDTTLLLALVLLISASTGFSLLALRENRRTRRAIDRIARARASESGQQEGRP